MIANRRRAMRWILFLTFIHSIPSPWFFVAVAGLAPTSLLLVVGLVGIFWITGASVAIALYVLAPALLYCLVYYGIAHLAATWIGRLRNRAAQIVVIVLITGPLLFAAFLPVYVSGGHGGIERGSIVDLWQITRLSRTWLYAYTAVFVLIMGGLLAASYRGSSVPRLSIPRLWATRVGRPVILVGGLGAVVGFIYLNHVLLVCRPLGQLGVTRAQVCMGDALLAGERNKLWGEQDARSWFERAARAGSPEATWTLYRISPTFAERRRWLRLAAERGHGAAQYELYRLLLKHERNESGRQAALRWLRAAADNQEARAQYDLGTAYRRGSDALGIPEDLTRARRWREAAAEQGHPRALWEVAGHYEHGSEGFPLDLDNAKRLYRRYARTQGDDDTQIPHQAAALFNADAHIAAIEALQAGIANSEPEAIRTLAFRHLEAYEPGPGVRQSGLALLERLANQGDPQAQYDLGAIYQSGRHDIAKDPTKGSEWWRRATEAHHLKAMARAANGYINGNYGFAVDYSKARSQIETLIKTYREGRYGAQADEDQAGRWERELAFVHRAIERSGGVYLPKEKLRAQASANDIQAQYQLARQLAVESMRKHGRRVLDLYKKAAAGGHVDAQWELFQLYRRGATYTSTDNPGKIFVVVAKDHRLALHYLQQAAGGHHPQAMAELALAHEKARFGLTKDLVTARDLYQKIVHAFDNGSYNWEVDERFIAMLRRRLEYSNRTLQNIEERRQRYENATELQRRIMDIEQDYSQEYARQVNAICVGNQRCTREYRERERERIRRQLFAARDQEIAGVRDAAARADQARGNIQ